MLLLGNAYSVNNSIHDSLKNDDFFQKKKLGFAYDFALTQQNLLYEYETYKPQLFQLIYSYSLTKENRKNFWGINIIPQINSVVITNKFHESHDFEFGTNVEVSFNHIVGKRVLFFVAIGTGPHYISHNRGRQAGGFLFSDNFIAGIRYKLDEDYEFKLHIKFRHMSNANLKLPNWGINNWMVGFTFLKNFNLFARKASVN
ncbi:MAG: hypothetical protein A2033_12145 [Bacteroidetes bacterium GWA2_31_9]|nr:MAG: hypothetical protein A2033_12145 [Bacteroidetes bacterium GWA2_31_9]